MLAALMAGPEDVRHLDLGDASWATEDKYAQQLVKLLRKYKKAVTNLSITMRALVQPSSGSMSKSQVRRYFNACWQQWPIWAAVTAQIGFCCRKVSIRGCN